MDFVRRQLFWIVCGVGAAAGVALGVSGLRAMPGVIKEMEVASQLYKSLEPLASSPCNRRALDAEDERINTIKEDYTQILEQAEKLFRREPLVKDALPEARPVATAGVSPQVRGGHGATPGVAARRRAGDGKPRQRDEVPPRGREGGRAKARPEAPHGMRDYRPRRRLDY